MEYILRTVIQTTIKTHDVSSPIHISGLQIRVHIGKLFLYFLFKTYVVGTQKNRLNETDFLSAQNTYLNLFVRIYLQFYAKKNMHNWPYDNL